MDNNKKSYNDDYNAEVKHQPLSTTKPQIPQSSMNTNSKKILLICSVVAAVVIVILSVILIALTLNKSDDNVLITNDVSQPDFNKTSKVSEYETEEDTEKTKKSSKSSSKNLKKKLTPSSSKTTKEYVICSSCSTVHRGSEKCPECYDTLGSHSTDAYCPDCGGGYDTGGGCHSFYCDICKSYFNACDAPHCSECDSCYNELHQESIIKNGLCEACNHDEVQPTDYCTLCAEPVYTEHEYRNECCDNCYSNLPMFILEDQSAQGVTGACPECGNHIIFVNMPDKLLLQCDHCGTYYKMVYGI